ncbi:MbnP family protein [uncultured Algibacter sp.]|uniref:MbnP family protein n=1 Tax=uncultured Algibacter sp. TaxID=298659 RepID=UPI0026337493|nr:MbnP family protein [uncultured Algibacter sp.]
MKIIKFACLIMLAISILSCSSDDNEEVITGSGSITVEFDNAYLDSDLLLNTSSYNASGTEKIKISKVKYIVSNIKLEDEDGHVYVVPKNESYFIVDESNEDSQMIELSDVPAANYTKITYGLGVDQAKYLEGADGQGDFLTKAQEAGMMWSWQAGYKFFVFEGLYTSDDTTTETAFAYHMGSHGTALDNYKEISMTLANTARVRTDMTPIVHIVADLSNTLMGDTEFKLDDAPQIHVDAVKSPQIATNVSGMFMVHHVHN